MKSLLSTTLFLASVFSLVQAAPTPSSTSPCTPSTTPSNLTYITLEEHYDSPASVPAQAANGIYAILAKFMIDLYDKYLSDIDEYRIPSMNENGIKMSVRFENISI